MNDERTKFPKSRTTEAWLVLLAALTWLAQIATAAALAASQAPPPEHLTATVYGFDRAAGTLDLLTGVGHALRVRHVLLAPRVEVRAGQAASGLEALMPGRIVRVEYHETKGQTIASSVELVAPPETGRKP